MRIPFLAALLLFPSIAWAAPVVSVKVEAPPTDVSRLTLEGSDEPLPVVLEAVAKKLGFAQLQLTDPALREKKVSYAFRDRPAWGCLLELSREHGFTFGTSTQALKIAPADGVVAVTYTGGERFLVCFAQMPTGTDVAQGRVACGAWILSDHRLGWTCTDLQAEAQKDTTGKACSFVALQPVGKQGLPQDGRVRFVAGQEAPSPWKALGSLTLRMKSTLVTERVVANVSAFDLSGQGLPLTVKHKDAELFQIDALAQKGNFIDLVLSFAATSQDEFVMQGGHGMDPLAMVGENYGMFPELLDAAGAPFSPAVVVGKGDGTRMKLTLRVTPHQAKKAGGLAALSLRWSKPTASVEREDTFVFEGLESE